MFTVRQARIALGVALSVVLLSFLSGNDLQQWLLPYLLVMGLISAVVAGPPWGWVISAAVFVIWAAVDSTRVILVFGPSLDWNLAAVLQAHAIEGLAISVYFVAVTVLGGLLGWGLSRAGSEVCRKYRV